MVLTSLKFNSGYYLGADSTWVSASWTERNLISVLLMTRRTGPLSFWERISGCKWGKHLKLKSPNWNGHSIVVGKDLQRPVWRVRWPGAKWVKDVSARSLAQARRFIRRCHSHPYLLWLGINLIHWGLIQIVTDLSLRSAGWSDSGVTVLLFTVAVSGNSEVLRVHITHAAAASPLPLARSSAYTSSSLWLFQYTQNTWWTEPS